MEIEQTPDSNRATIVFVGHARLPQALGSQGAPTVVSVEVEVDVATRQIVDASCSPVPHLGERMVRDMLLGRNLDDGLDAVATELQHRYISPSQRALSTAICNVYESYARWLTGRRPAAAETPASP